MNSMIKTACCGLSALLLSACSGYFEQDPLAEKAEAIRNAQPPDSKPQPKVPQASDAIRIEAPDFVSFKEGRTDKFSLRGRVLIANYDVTLAVDNLKAFSGAQFDGKSGEFSWTPPKGTVMDKDIFQEMALEVSAIATPKNPQYPILRGQKKIRLVVNRQPGTPEIVKVQAVRNQIREGEVVPITVIVHDPDGGQLPDQYPQLQILGARRGVNLSPHVTVSSVQPDFNNNRWSFTLSLNLESVEVTPHMEDGQIRVQAVSRYGRPSAEALVDFLVSTNFGQPESTWVSRAEVTPGIENRVPFLVFDPRREADLVVTPTRLPNGSRFSCLASGSGLLKCEFIWRPPYNQREEDMLMSIQVVATNPNKRDSFRRVVTLNLPLLVKFGPPPGTSPTPTPTPTPPAPPSPNPPTPAPPVPAPNPTPTPAPPAPAPDPTPTPAPPAPAPDPTPAPPAPTPTPTPAPPTPTPAPPTPTPPPPPPAPAPDPSPFPGFPAPDPNDPNNPFPGFPFPDPNDPNNPFPGFPFPDPNDPNNPFPGLPFPDPSDATNVGGTP